ncbi:hypothetical protein AAES_61341 [Amazona aestiva]|uniref:SEA domain-containing protein n=1 Tax=Amazona aestiva TaxID=12930 RepID=A0A0Q3PQE9_AMAAE|nr:hypothetical protein AAES_61341 [Amazona aestiva]
MLETYSTISKDTPPPVTTAYTSRIETSSRVSAMTDTGSSGPAGPSTNTPVSITPTAPSQAPTTAAALERFTINFTITNLPYNSDLATPGSTKFNTTRRVMTTLLDQLLRGTSIGPTFLGCEKTAFRFGSCLSVIFLSHNQMMGPIRLLLLL